MGLCDQQLSQERFRQAESSSKLQGLGSEVTVVWHPRASLAGFHLDPGRLCVLLTRHRQAWLVVGREGDEDMLEDRVPPPTAADLDWGPDPLLDGWEVHREVFAALEPFRVSA